MRIVIAPASPRTGRAITEALLRNAASASVVVGVYRDLSKVPAAFSSNPRFEAVQGDVANAETLKLGKADVVVTISPPNYSGNPDPITAARTNATNVAQAVAKSGTVKRVVYVSSMGAEHEHGTGEVGSNHAVEQVLRDAAPEVVFVRCAYFMHNWNLPTLQEAEPFIYSSISPADFKIPMVAVKDIGATCAEYAAGVDKPLPESPFAFQLYGPEEYSTADVQEALTQVLGKHVRAEIIPKEGLPDFYSSFLPPNVSQLFIEMTTSLLAGGVMDASKPPTGTVKRGKVSLAEGFKEMLSS